MDVEGERKANEVEIAATLALGEIDLAYSLVLQKWPDHPSAYTYKGNH